MPRKPTTPAPTTEWLPISSLVVDHTVNTRPPKQAKVEKIAAEFDPEAIGIIEVSRRPNGAVVILDGQHRVEALKHLGWNNGQLIECKVHTGLTHSQECRAFRLLNDETAVPPIFKLLAGIGEGHEPEASIGAIVASVGLTIAGAQGDGQICSAKALRQVYGGGRLIKAKSAPEAHPDLLRDTLRTILAAWGKSKHAMRGEIIQGVGAFLARYGGAIDRETLITRLAQETPLGVIADARALRSIHGWQMSGAVAARIVMLYNKGKRTKALPDWWAS